MFIVEPILLGFVHVVGEQTSLVPPAKPFEICGCICYNASLVVKL